jgi:hypothetical protein
MILFVTQTKKDMLDCFNLFEFRIEIHSLGH